MIDKIRTVKMIKDSLKRVNLDSLDDCKRLIESIAEICDQYGGSEDSLLATTDSEAESFLKILFDLNKVTSFHKAESPCKTILDVINNVLSKSETCTSTNLGQCILQVIDFMLVTAAVIDIGEDIYILANFYMFNLECISETPSEDYEQKHVDFRLDILCRMYLKIQSFTRRNQNFSKFAIYLKSLKEKNGVRETDVLSSILLNGCDEAFKKTLLFIVPDILRCLMDSHDVDGTEALLEAVWTNISNVIKCQDENLNLWRILMILCYFHNIEFNMEIPSKSIKLMEFIFGDEQYWKMMLYGLGDKKYKKQALYLFKSTLKLLSKEDIHLVVPKNMSNSMYIWWDSNEKIKINSMYEKIIVISEYLDEQQVHIIVPMLSMVEEVVGQIFTKLSGDKYIDFSWILLIYEQMLKHESNQIAKWGLESFMKLPDILYLDNNTCARAVSLFINSVNNNNLYYNGGVRLRECFVNYFKRLVYSESAQFFFTAVIRRICELEWSSEPLFLVVHSLVQSGMRPFWQTTEIKMMESFIRKAFVTHDKVIRMATQNELLTAIMSFTDTDDVSLESLTPLLYGFRTLGLLKWRTAAWRRLTPWLQSHYKMTENHCLYLFQKKGSDARFLAFLVILFTDVDSENETFITFTEICLRKFINAGLRPYCSEAELNSCLNMISAIAKDILSGSTTETSKLIESIRIYSQYLSQYIQAKLNRLEGLDNLNLVSVITETFDSLSSDMARFKFDMNDVTTHEISQKPINSLPPGMLYCYLSILKTKLENNVIPLSELHKFVYLYLMNNVNESLEKSISISQSVWGTINSKFLENKWRIFKCLIVDLKMHEKESASKKDLLKLCLEGLEIGGSGVQVVVMPILGCLLPSLKDSVEKTVIDSAWTGVMEGRKSSWFRCLIESFVKMLFQTELMSREDYHDVHIKYADLIFTDSVGVVNVFMKHIQNFKLGSNLNLVMCHVISKALIFGPILRKDERLKAQVYTLIESLKLYEISDHDTSNEIRGKTVAMLLSLDNADSKQREFAWKMAQQLITVEKKANEKKVRYFGDSQPHRMKHRLMQALLLLEPMINSNQNEVQSLSSWLYNGLLLENNQPSVKYQQEWLLIRLLVRHPSLIDEFWIRLNQASGVEIKAKGVCSLILIAYHLCKVSLSKASSYISEAFIAILPFAMDQQFETRLHAQVVLKKLYQLAISNKLQNVLERYEVAYNAILKSIQRGYRGNSSKNCDKLEQDFYLNIFHPFENYTLQTIFMDLPRLANVGSDECISHDVFKRCGLFGDQATIKVNNEKNSLANVEFAHWFNDGPFENEGAAPKSESRNFQKKMIPFEASGTELFHGFEPGSGRSAPNVNKDGLIVVASLIDRVPNLGGLARTCEIFGASEYILGSLKYIEDKQFGSLSVTAEKWLTIKEVKEQNLVEYLLEMKKLEYVVIGAEQTLHSQSLNVVKFPKKSLILLGNEKEGIPPNLLPLLDVCVEIPQVGVIRSLNVHVTGALFVWEYAKQNFFSVS